MADLELALRIRADLQQALRQLDRLQAEMGQTGRAGHAAGRGGRAAAGGIDQAGAAAERSSRGVGLLKGALAGIGFAVLAREAVDLVRDIKDVGVAFEGLESRFRFATGSIAAGAQEMAFVREQADRLGLDLLAAADGYSALTASARGTVLEGQATRDIFLAVSEAAAVLNLTSEQTNGALTAIEQIISKGRVSAEELRGQLGERLPGAFQIAARAMGVTTQELDEMLAAGELLSVDFLPRFAAEVRQTFAGDVPAATERSAASFARLGNSILELKNAIAESGLLEFLSNTARAMTQIVNLARGISPRGSAEDSRINALLDLREDAAPSQRIDIEQSIYQELLQFEETGRRISTAVADRIRDQAFGIPTGLLKALEDVNDVATVTPTPVPAGAGGNEKEYERAQAALTKILEREEARRVLLTEGRVAAVELLEQRQLQELDDLKAKGLAAAGGDAEKQLEIRQAYHQAVVELEASTTEQVRKIRGDASAREERRLEREAVASERAAERQRQTAFAVFTALQDVEADLGLVTPYEQAERAAARWRDETIQALRDVGLGHGELAAQVEAAYQRILEANREQTTALGGIREALRDYAADAADRFTSTRDAAQRAFRGMEDALVQFSTTGKLEIKSLANSIIADLARIAIQRNITGPIAQALFGSIGGGGGGGGLFAPFLHGGGRAGRDGVRRREFPAELFAFAPRYHRGGIAGLEPDEVPTILQRGERVIPRGEAAGMMPVQINFHNQGTPQREVSRQVRMDPRGLVVDVILDDLSNGGPIRGGIQRLLPPGGAGA